MPRQSSKSKKEIAQYLYITGMTNQRELADFVDTSETQISRWKLKYNWAELRKARSITSQQLIANAYEQAERIYNEAKEEDRTINSKEADTLVKISAQIKNLEKELNAQTAMTVFKAFNEFLIREGKHELAKQLADSEYIFIVNLMPAE